LLQHEGKKFDCIPKPSPKLFKNFTYHQSGKIKFKNQNKQTYLSGKSRAQQGTGIPLGYFEFLCKSIPIKFKINLKKKENKIRHGESFSVSLKMFLFFNRFYN
jgi:hypothetical protein